jgi:hypothetical protein
VANVNLVCGDYEGIFYNWAVFPTFQGFKDGSSNDIRNVGNDNYIST